MKNYYSIILGLVLIFSITGYAPNKSRQNDAKVETQYDYRSVAIDKRGYPNTVASRIETACKKYGKDGFILKQTIITTVRLNAQGNSEEALILVFEKRLQ